MSRESGVGRAFFESLPYEYRAAFCAFRLGRLEEYRRQSPGILAELNEDGLEYYWGFFDLMEDERAARTAVWLARLLL